MAITNAESPHGVLSTSNYDLYSSHSNMIEIVSPDSNVETMKGFLGGECAAIETFPSTREGIILYITNPDAPRRCPLQLRSKGQSSTCISGCTENATQERASKRARSRVDGGPWHGQLWSAHKGAPPPWLPSSLNLDKREKLSSNQRERDSQPVYIRSTRGNRGQSGPPVPATRIVYSRSRTTAQEQRKHILLSAMNGANVCSTKTVTSSTITGQ
ncbi:10448_t:CDS:2, partial [Acaulospora colombiana]